MHGSIMHAFKQFVIAQHGNPLWEAVAQVTGAQGWYLHNSTYSDAELQVLVSECSRQLKEPEGELLERFGVYVVPTLFQFYGAFVDPRWRTFELIAHTEDVIHRAVRIRNPEVQPPHLVVRQVGPDEIRIEYSSARRLCDLAVGICRGVADHYGEHIVVEQATCMKYGAPACELIVKLS
jgi:hypothetical protein